MLAATESETVTAEKVKFGRLVDEVGTVSEQLTAQQRRAARA